MNTHIYIHTYIYHIYIYIILYIYHIIYSTPEPIHASSRCLKLSEEGLLITQLFYEGGSSERGSGSQHCEDCGSNLDQILAICPWYAVIFQ